MSLRSKDLKEPQLPKGHGSVSVSSSSLKKKGRGRPPKPKPGCKKKNEPTPQVPIVNLVSDPLIKEKAGLPLLPNRDSRELCEKLISVSRDLFSFVKTDSNKAVTDLFKTELGFKVCYVKVPYISKPFKDDPKLLLVSKVVISSSCKRKADNAMKLRKKPGEPQRQAKKDPEPDDESLTDTTQSQSDSEDGNFIPSPPPKKVAKRRESKCAPKSKLLPSPDSVAPNPKRKSTTGHESESDSSVESLPDIPPCGATGAEFSPTFIYQSKKEVKHLPTTSSATTSGSKSPRRAEETLTESSLRTLRSSSYEGCGHTPKELSTKASSSKPTMATTTPKKKSSFTSNKIDQGQQKPPRLRSASGLKPLTSVTTQKSVDSNASSAGKKEPEKTYPLRHVEKTGSLQPATVTPKIEGNKAPRPSLSLPKHLGPKSNANVSHTKETDDPPAKRTRRATSSIHMDPSDVQQKQGKGTKLKSDLKFQKNLRDQAQAKKPQRDAVAVRAKRSKIMAKSRVLQSNKYEPNASWRKQLPKRKSAVASPLKDVGIGKLASRPSPPLLVDDQGDKLSEEESSIDENEDEQGELEITTGSSVVSESGKPGPSQDKKLAGKITPAATCGVCNLTFTRKFSYTKHLATRQHQRMVRKSGQIKRRKKEKESEKDEKVLLRQKGIKRVNIQEEDNQNPPSNSVEKEVEPDTDEDEEYDLEPHIPIPGWTSGRVLESNNFQCDVCGDIFIKKFDFTSHLFNHRAGSDLVCPDCGLKFADSERYNEHIDCAHEEGPIFICTICPSKFTREDYLKKHIESHQYDDENMLTCHVCGMGFQTYELLCRHFDMKHLELGHPKTHFFYGDSSDESSEPDDDDNDNGDGDGKGMKRRRREYTSRYQSSDKKSEGPKSDRGEVIRKYQQQSRLTDNIIIGCGKTETIEPEVPETSKTYDPLSCKDCGRTFGSRKDLVGHVEDSSSCTDCRKSGPWRYPLNRQPSGKVQMKSTKEQMLHRQARFLRNRDVPQIPGPSIVPVPESTNKPDPAFSTEEKDLDDATTVCSSLAAPEDSPINEHAAGSDHIIKNLLNPSRHYLQPEGHVRPVFTRPHTPKMAETETEGATDDKSEASTSTSILMDAGSFEPQAGQDGVITCDLCTKCFTSSKTLVAHKGYHQNQALYSCPNCDAKCERKSDFDLHYKCHEKKREFYLCYVCFKPFRWKKDMVRHVRKKHSDEKTYRCVYCAMRFQSNDDLTIHVSSSHATHRSFSCKFCPRRYAQKRYLLLHVKTNHSAEAGSEVDDRSDQLQEDDPDIGDEPDQEDLFELEDDDSSFPP